MLPKFKETIETLKANPLPAEPAPKGVKNWNELSEKEKEKTLNNWKR